MRDRQAVAVNLATPVTGKKKHPCSEAQTIVEKMFLPRCLLALDLPILPPLDRQR